MAKRTSRQSDDARTERLGLDELFVLKGRGDQNNYFAWQYEHEPEHCPLCGEDVLKIQGRFSKTYSDYIIEDDQPHIISLNYEFFKYRCLNDKCRHIFANEINFASRSDRVTFRLEHEISRKVMEGYSYSRIQELFQETISRQAVGQIFHRWVKKKEDLRSIRKSPAALGIFEGQTGETEFTLFLSLDEGVRIYDVLSGVSSSDIGHILRRIGPSAIKAVISDCNPVINDTINDYIPDALHIIPVEFWFRMISNEFQTYAHKIIRWSAVKDKDELIMTPRSRLGYRISDVERLLADRPEIKPLYEDYNNLHELIERRGELWVFEELLEWVDSLCINSKECLASSLYLLKTFGPEITAQTEHREAVPERLSEYVSELENVLSGAKIFSEDVLKARVLYAVEADLYNWHGVPIEDVINTLKNMNIATHRKRRDNDEYQ